MGEDPSRNLDVLGQLAREYQLKFREVSELCQHADPHWVYAQLKGRGERTTDRFRMAQQVVLHPIALEPADQGLTEAQQATFTLCRCFDEMRILFQNLLEYCLAQVTSGTDSSENPRSS